MTTGSTYRAWGLTIRSALPLPELTPADGPADVAVTLGDAPASLPGATCRGARFEAEPGRLLLRVGTAASYLISHGREIVIDRRADACDEDVRLFLLGSAMGALLLQRGSLVLQASAVEVDDGCVVFLGKSSVGKSTLAAAFARRGHRFLADNVCALTSRDGITCAFPAYPQASLWPDSVKQLGMETGALRLMRPSLDKRVARFEGPTSSEPLPVREAFVLSPTRTIGQIQRFPIEGAAKIRVLRDYTYRAEFLRGLGLSSPHFGQLAALGSGLRLSRLIRPETGFALDDLATLVERALK